MPVHLFGRAANMEAIMAIAKEHNLYVIEDNAQAIGANCKFSDGTKKKAGTIGHVASTSFFPSKNLGCYGDGGAIFTNDDELAHKIRGIVNHGMYVRYHHDVVGVNSRLDSIQAGVLKAKLPFWTPMEKPVKMQLVNILLLLKDIKILSRQAFVIFVIATFSINILWES